METPLTSSPLMDVAPPTAPTREQIAAVLEDLIAGSVTREAVATWAWRWVTLPDPGINDDAVWSVVMALSGCDDIVGLIERDREYLYGTVDFRDWLNEVRDG